MKQELQSGSITKAKQVQNNSAPHYKKNNKMATMKGV